MALHQHGSNNPLGIDRRGPQDYDPVPSVLHGQGHVRAVRVPAVLRDLRVLCAELPGQLGQLHPGEPDDDAAAHRARMVLPAVYAILRSVPSNLSIPGKLIGVVLMFGVGPDPVSRALARHLAGAQRPVPADLQMVSWLLVDRRRSRSAMSAPIAAGLDRHDRADRHLLLLHPLPDPDAADRQDRDAAAVAAQHRRRGARTRRGAAGPRRAHGGESPDMRSIRDCRRCRLACR